MAAHGSAPLGQNHIPYNGEYADATAREAATGFVAGVNFVDGGPDADPPGDLGKLARQLDDDSLWMLTAITPAVVWKAVGNTSTGVTATGTLTGDAVVLGNGGTDTKVVAGITTDGISRLQLGVAAGAIGGVEFRNATSGTVSIVPPTGPLGTAVLTLPIGADTLTANAATQTLSNKTFVAPALGTPASGVLTNCTGLPISTGVAGLGTNVATFLATPSFANLSAAVTGATLFSSTTKSSALQAAQLVTLTSSSTDTYAGTAGVAATAYAVGDLFVFKANTANTGAASLNVDGLGAVTIVKVAGGVTTALANNDIRVDQMVVVQYDGTNFQIQSTLGNAAGAGGTPGGSDTQLQFNNAGAFGGISGATSNGTTVTFGTGTLLATEPQITTGIRASNGDLVLAFNTAATPANRAALTQSATGNPVILSAEGSDTNVGISLAPKGTGTVRVNGTNPTIALQLSGTTKNSLKSETSAGADIVGSAVDDFCFRNYASKNILFSTDNGSTIGLKITATSSGATGLEITPNTSGNAAIIGAQLSAIGADSNIAITLSPKGTGIARINNANPALGFLVSGTFKNSIRSETSAGSDITGSAVDDLCFRNYASKAMLFSTDNGSTISFQVLANNAGISSVGPMLAPAATTSITSIRLPHGTAPSSPTNGDMWTTTAGLFVRINGATVGPLT